MAWIDNKIARPLKEGYYKCLVEIDEMGCMIESERNKFDGQDWSPFESNCQFISYWWATNEEYKELSITYEKGYEKYCESNKL